MAKKQNHILSTKEIGEKLKDARTASGLKQTDIAELSGLSRHQIINIESGLNKGSIDLLLIYSNALQQTPDQLLGIGSEEVNRIVSDAKSSFFYRKNR